MSIVRGQVITRRTYNRPLDEKGTKFETWAQTIDRNIEHQRWLWVNAQGDDLNVTQEAELTELRSVLFNKMASVSGRSLWLGGTEVVKRRAASAFNCSFLDIRSVHDVVDAFWLLLQGCGVGFSPKNGTLSGFTRKMEVEIIRSTRTEKGGCEKNVETYDQSTKTWTIAIGDSAEAWAKSIGKIMGGKFPAKKIVIDCSNVRPAGERLAGYGWLCTGDEQLSVAFRAICDIMNKCAGKLLRKNDIIDIINWLGTVLSSRRSAQIALMDYGDAEWREFASRKPKGFDSGPNWFRGQSNNSLVFWEKPTKKQLSDIFDLMIEHGGGEPGVINGVQAMTRAPWFKGVNPCIPSDSWILTSEGPRQVSDLIDRPFEAIVDGKPYPSTQHGFFKSGTKTVFKVETKRGFSFECTENHNVFKVTNKKRNSYEKLPLRDIKVGDKIRLGDNRSLNGWNGLGTFEEGWLLGNLVGDGYFHEDTSSLEYYGETRIEMAEYAKECVKSSSKCRASFGRFDIESKTNKERNMIRIKSLNVSNLAERFGIGRDKSFSPLLEKTSSDFHRGFVSGMFDADGTVYVSKAGRGTSAMLTSVRLDHLEVVHRMMARLGVVGSIRKRKNRARSKTGVFCNRKGVTTTCKIKDAYDIHVYGDNLNIFSDSIGFKDSLKQNKLTSGIESYARGPRKERFNDEIVSIEEVGVKDVYDCTVYDASKIDVNSFVVTNCGEILLPDKGFCNLVELPVSSYKNDFGKLRRNTEVMARANYRQTVVDLRDGILQDSWHQQNEYLRLCGVGLTGLACRPDLSHWDFIQLKDSAIYGAYTMADELGLQRPKNVTCIKPSGTLSKAIFDTTEGCHLPKGRYLFNTVSFSKLDPLVNTLRAANYRVDEHPYDSSAVLVVFPVSYPDVKLDLWNGFEVDRESAVTQLRRYKMLQRSYVQQNTSITVSYEPDEKNAIVKEILDSWDDYVACSFLFRDNPVLTAEDLGYAYMPQRAVSKLEYDDYAAKILPVDVEAVADEGFFDLDGVSECAGGACPIK